MAFRSTADGALHSLLGPAYWRVEDSLRRFLIWWMKCPDPRQPSKPSFMQEFFTVTTEKADVRANVPGTKPADSSKLLPDELSSVVRFVLAVVFVVIIFYISVGIRRIVKNYQHRSQRKKKTKRRFHNSSLSCAPDKLSAVPSPQPTPARVRRPSRMAKPVPVVLPLVLSNTPIVTPDSIVIEPPKHQPTLDEHAKKD
ncbi:hypothetical protein AAVH_04469 [Aphelenchoides avenae]|nr:hypothetical protein AAVH_04469 [Aphelenchus avenae]